MAQWTAVDDALEVAERTIPGDLDDPTAMFGNKWLDHLLAMSLEAFERAALVTLHQSRIADDIRREHRGKSAFDARRCHDAALQETLDDNSS